MRRRVGLVAVVVIGAVTGASGASADFVIPTPPKEGPNARLASKAVNAAVNVVSRRDQACVLRPHPSTGSVTHEPPPQAMLDAFAVLRRPAAPGDDLSAKPELLAAWDEVAVDYVRRARVLPDGTSIYVIPSLNALPTFDPRPERCDARERLALEHRLRGKPRQAQRAARRLLRSLQRSQRVLTRQGPQPGLFVEALGPHGGGGGGGQDVDAIRKFGLLTSSYVRGRGARLFGLIPDGVATVDLTFPRGEGLGPGRKHLYRTVYRRTVAVVDNIVYLTVPRRPEDTFFTRQVWRAADGSVVNRIEPPSF